MKRNKRENSEPVRASLRDELTEQDFAEIVDVFRVLARWRDEHQRNAEKKIMRCIYCLEEKDASSFSGREHVIPQAFGVFDTNNLVLKCVCDDCNHAFSVDVDLKFARDSAEAIDRITVGLKPAKEFKSLGARSTSHVEFQAGDFAGGKGYAVASRDDGDVLGVMAFPQVWFAKSAEGPFEKFLLDDVPTKDELIAMGYTIGGTLHIRTFEIDDAFGFLETKGFNVADAKRSPIDQPTGRVPVENVTRISEPEFRVVTKIALNYLAAVVGSEIALDKVFDNARNFARYGKEKGRVRVYPFENPWFKGRNGHYISLTRSEDMVIVQLSILMRTQYFIVLAEQATSVPVVSTAHFFDRDANVLTEIEPLRLTRGKPLKPIKD